MFLRLIINSVKFSEKKEENESKINERKDRKEGKTCYKERRVIKVKKNGRIFRLDIPCLQYRGHNRK